MVRLCSKSSRSYSGRPVTRACRPRQDWPPAMTLRREQESAEAIVPGATSRKTKPDGLTTREGLNLAGRHDHRWSCPGAMRPNRLSYGQRSSWQQECCVIPQGLPGTAVRGPACTVVWEPGGETLPATRLVPACQHCNPSCHYLREAE